MHICYKFKWLRWIYIMLLPRHPELKDWPKDATQKCHVETTLAIDSIWRWVTTAISNLLIDGVSIPLFSLGRSHRRSTYTFDKENSRTRAYIAQLCRWKGKKCRRSNQLFLFTGRFFLVELGAFVAGRWCTCKVSFLPPTSVIYPHQFEEAFSVCINCV